MTVNESDSYFYFLPDIGLKFQKKYIYTGYLSLFIFFLHSKTAFSLYTK